jgi:hypothetical protein
MAGSGVVAGEEELCGGWRLAAEPSADAANHMVGCNPAGAISLVCYYAGGLLKEAVDDLVWLSGVKLTHDPAAILLMQVSWGAASSYFQPLRVLQVFGKCCYAVASATPSANAGGLLKEAVDDLEWPGGSVVVKLTHDPAAMLFMQVSTGCTTSFFNHCVLHI